MRIARIPTDEQFRLIMECRASGFTDHEWCMQNGICTENLYNCVKYLYRMGCTDISKAARAQAYGRWTQRAGTCSQYASFPGRYSNFYA